MKVNVLAFGIAKEIFGGSVIDVDLNGASTVAELKASLEAKYPRLRQLKSYMIAVNNEYAEGEILIESRDEIAIIPPVSGG